MNKKLLVQVLDPCKETVAQILEGHNLFFEDVTKRRLIAAYRDLAKLEDWRLGEITKGGGGDSEKNLKYWLLGLTKKT